jgi:hypothetical protein
MQTKMTEKKNDAFSFAVDFLMGGVSAGAFALLYFLRSNFWLFPTHAPLSPFSRLQDLRCPH